MKARFLIAVLYLFFSSPNNFAQALRFEHYTADEGLSNNAINCFFQDNKGFIWIGTEVGLNKFDGYTFTRYQSKFDDSTSLSDNYVHAIDESSDGKLWISTNDGGVCVFNPSTEKFKQYKADINNPHSLLNNNIVDVLIDSLQNCWVLSSNAGLNLYRQATDDFEQIKLPIDGKIRERTGSLLYADKNNTIWIASNLGLISYSPGTGKIKQFLPKSDVNSFEENRVILLEAETDSVFIIATLNNIYRFDRIHETFKSINTSLTDYLRLYQPLFVKSDGYFYWIGTYNGGLLKYNKITGKYTVYKVEKGNPSSISSDIVNVIFKDRSGSLWAGSYLGGINKFESETRFNCFLEDEIIASFFEKDDNLWIGTQTSGFYLFNKKTGKLQNFRNNINNPASLSYNSAISIYIDQTNTLWVGTWEHGINRVKLKNKIPDNPRFEHLLISESILCITPDSKQRLWFGTNNDLLLYKPETDNFDRFTGSPWIPASFGQLSVQCITPDNAGNLWIGTWNGLHHAFLPENEDPTPQNVKFKSYANDPLNPNSLSDNRTLCVCVAKDGTIWTGTYARGINKLNLVDETSGKYICKRYSKQDGLPDDCVFGIQEDEKGLLWISTNKGFASFDPQKEVFVSYDKNDGFAGEDFQWRASYKNSEGLMYFGSSHGYISFYPDKISYNTAQPQVVITGFSIFNEPVHAGEENSPLKTSIGTTSEIKINYNQSMISFDFAALNYINTYKNKYKYKLDGFDKNWVNSGKQRRATYTNLDPGTYIFRVSASNNDGVWNNDGVSVKLVVLPPWWKTWWFRVTAIALVIFCAYILFRWRVKTLQNQQKNLKKLVEEKTEEILLQKQDLEAMNEELTATNEELYNQRRDLEELNKKLTATNQQLFLQKEELETAISSLKTAQQQLIQSEKMASLGILSAGIAHEINNPLNFIVGGVVGIEDYLSTNFKEHFHELSPLIEALNIGVRRATNVVSSLRHYSSSDELPFEEVDIHEIIDNCTIMLNSKFQHRIEVIKKYTQKPYKILGNEGKLHQAILNLLANAEQSIANAGIIKITSDVDKNMLILVINDTGCGINKNILPKIFDPFYTTKSPGKGTGLGLSITYNIIKEHKGTLEFESEENIGTKVTIRLPLNISDEA